MISASGRQEDWQCQEEEEQEEQTGGLASEGSLTRLQLAMAAVQPQDRVRPVRKLCSLGGQNQKNCFLDWRSRNAGSVFHSNPSEHY